MCQALLTLHAIAGEATTIIARSRRPGRSPDARKSTPQAPPVSHWPGEAVGVGVDLLDAEVRMDAAGAAC